jgi:hypothetical protein
LGIMNAPLHAMDCTVVIEPGLPDRFYMDMRVYQVVKQGASFPEPGGNPELWRGIYLAVEVKPHMDTGRQIKTN